MTDFQIGILKLVKSALTGESVSVPGGLSLGRGADNCKKASDNTGNLLRR